VVLKFNQLIQTNTIFFVLHQKLSLRTHSEIPRFQTFFLFLPINYA
jgi:hypothetical protein